MSFGYKKLSIILALFVSSLTLNGCVTMLVGGAAAGVGAVVGSDSRTVDVQVDDQKIENEASSYLSNDRMRSDPKVFLLLQLSLMQMICNSLQMVLRLLENVIFRQEK